MLLSLSKNCEYDILSTMEQDLLKLKNDASSLIIAAEDEEELNQIKLAFLGRSGKLTQLVKGVINVPEDRRADVGKTSVGGSMLEGRALLVISPLRRHSREPSKNRTAIVLF